MYLRSLRLKGFKSFPRQTDLVFEPGVAVVIGPNGSGKSNVADAVLWALGEQSPTSVRGSSMQDVIFAGSDGRRASVAAEVELTFDNSDGALSIPTPEVSIGRRVERGGETKYFINKASCRLVDVLEVTAQMGLGREMHSIIGQGKVESMLAAKPSDRRALVEEAAGLGRFKRRRERAELKLREVGRNLVRARDLEKEAASQLSPLRRQANAAELQRAVERDLAEVRGRLLWGDLEALDGRLAAQTALAEAVIADRAGVDERVAAAEAARLAAEEAFARHVEERETRAGRSLKGRYLGDRLESCSRLVGQRLELLAEVEAASRAELEGLAVERAGEVGGDAADPAGQLDLLEEAVRSAEAAHGELAAQAGGLRAELGERRASLAHQELERESATQRVERLTQRREKLSADLDRRAAELGAAAGAQSEVEGSLERGGIEADQASASRAESEAALVVAGADLEAAREALGEADNALRRAAAERAALEAEIEHSGAALRELNDLGDDVTRVIADWPGIKTLAGVAECEPGYERALGAALSQYPSAVAVPADVDQWSVFEALRGAGIRLVRLLVGRPGTGAGAGAFPGALPLLDKVSLEGDADGERALRDVVIVDDLRAVPGSFAGLAVTRDGAFYRPSTGELGLAAEVPATLLLERKSRLAGLTQRIDAVRAREARDSAAAARAKAAVEVAAQARAVAAESADAAIGRDDQARRHAETLVAERQILAERHARLVEAVAAGEKELGELDAGTTALTARLAVSAAEIVVLATDVVTTQQSAVDLEARHDEALATLTRARIELEERGAQAARAREERARAERRAASARSRSVQLESRLVALPGLREACGGLSEVLARLRGRSAPLVERLNAEAAAAEVKISDRERARSLADEEVVLRRAGDDLAERRATVQVEIARLEERRGDLAARFGEVAAQLDTNVFQAPADEAEAASLRSRTERLERKRDGIGPVNPLAEDECARLQEHVDFLREQTRELEKSLHETELLIRELSERIEVDFGEMFGVIAANFSRMVTTLFPGGSGSLTLIPGDEPDDLGGIDIRVKPARKLGKRLALLSGGERSLVALAFLLALLLSRPAPFYILDEVEAALDDINIGLFVSLVRQHRETTQFIVITHQKRTMEAADVLYGVTMGPDGTSQVVSARMAEDEIDQETARGGGEPPRA